MAHYQAMVNELCIGPCIAIEVSGKQEVVQTFRALAGHPDPEVAQNVAPKSLRALFGTDKIHCGVMASTLPEDGPLEV